MRKSVAISLMCWIVALITGDFIQRHWPSTGNLSDADKDIVNLLFGESKAVVSNKMYDMADFYFHKGIAHEYSEDHDHAGHDPLAQRYESQITPQHEAHDDDHIDSQHDMELSAHPDDWLSRINQALKPNSHEHLRGKRAEKEILPWIWLAVKTDVTNIMAYDTGAFFLAERLDRTEEALALLADGISHNPSSTDLYFARGEILYHRTKDYEKSLEDFMIAAQLWQDEYKLWADAPANDNIPQPSTLKYFRILSYIAHIEENAGNYENALDTYVKSIAFAPTEQTRDDALLSIERVKELLR